MKTTNFHHKIWLLYCILLCIPFYFQNVLQTALGAEPQNNLTVDEFVDRTFGSIKLPQVQGPLYLECSLPKTHFYLGERVPVTITLYVGNIVVANVDWPTLIQPEFILDKAGNSSEQKLRINGRSYQVIKFPCLLSPLQTGSFQLGPVNETLYLPTTNGRKRSMDVTANPVRIRVSDLPSQGRPDHFSGGVGHFQLRVSATPRQVKLGEPVTIQMTISGSGNLQVISTPLLNNIAGLKAYPAVKKNNSSAMSKVTFEQIVIPIDTRVRQVGPVSFSYFNPSTGKYARLISSALPISVKTNPSFKNEESPSIASGSLQSKILPIQKEIGPLYSKDWQWIKRPWFWFWQLLPIILLIGAMAYKKYHEFMQSDSPRARAIRSGNAAKKQIAAIQNICLEGRYNDLPDTLHQILQEFLSERFELAAAGITGSVVKTLSEKGVPCEILKDIHDFFEQYDSYRFAHLELNQEQTMLLLDKMKRILASFDKIH